MLERITVGIGMVLVAIMEFSIRSSDANPELTVTLPGGATMEMVWIEPGTFLMGTTEEQEQLLRNKKQWGDWEENEQPAHEVTITKGRRQDRSVAISLSYARFSITRC